MSATATKTKAFRKLRPKDNQTNGAELKLLTIETGIPIPVRGSHDPAFHAKIVSILKDIKPLQSFVVEAKKVHSVQQMAKRDFTAYKMRVSHILPDKKFARIWRLL